MSDLPPLGSEPRRRGGGIAKKARLELEQKTGKPVVSGNNFLPPGKKAIERRKK